MSRLRRELNRPIVIAHRGASGLLPEQTIEAFDLAVKQGADAIELDIVTTRDGVLLTRHENELSLTTNVADLPEFAGRRAVRSVDGAELGGWFAEEFTAAEVRTLSARQRFSFRDHGFDDRFHIPTLDDVLRWRSGVSRPVQLFIEIKHPTYFAGIGLTISDLLIQTLKRFGLLKRDSGIVLKSFETRVLRELRDLTDLPLVQLVDAREARPFDWEAAGDRRTYADLLTRPGLTEVATYAEGIGAWKRLIVPTQVHEPDGVPGHELRLAAPTNLIHDAHAAGLFISAWTFRDEPQFLAADYAQDPRSEYRQFIELGVDGIITDFPSTALATRDSGAIQRSSG